jgi:cardiolipin synthase
MPNEMNFFDESKSYFDEALQSIRLAKTEILLESYIFDLDSVGLAFLEALEIARQNGVKVFVSVDRIGSWNTITPLVKWAKIHQISLHVFNSRLVSINKRNHRKLLVVDKSIVFLGSLNISAAHLKWRDYGVRSPLTDTEYHLIRRRFFAARSQWLALRELLSLKKLATSLKGRKLKTPASRFLFNDSIASRLFLARLLIRSIKKSQKRVWISSPYFLPRSFMLRSLIRASKRGVDVRIIIPAKSDIWLVKLATRSLLRKLNRQNIKIYSYQEKIWHAKSLLTDTHLFLGSHNWNHRSFLHDLEIILSTTHISIIQELEASYKKDLLKCQIISVEDLQKDPPLIKILGHIIYLFRYWL